MTRKDMYPSEGTMRQLAYCLKDYHYTVIATVLNETGSLDSLNYTFYENYAVMMKWLNKETVRGLKLEHFLTEYIREARKADVYLYDKEDAMKDRLKQMNKEMKESA